MKLTAADRKALAKRYGKYWEMQVVKEMKDVAKRGKENEIKRS